MDNKMIASMSHWGMIFLGFLAPLLVYLLKGKEDALIESHGKSALNAVISIMIYSFVASILSVILIGFLIFPVIFVIAIIGMIKNSSLALEGKEAQPYPLVITFLK